MDGTLLTRMTQRLWEDKTASRVERPIIVLGAARSGTKLLRSILATHPDVVAIPDDINYVWKFGQYHVPHDGLTPASASPERAQFIHRYFRNAYNSQAGSTPIVVEKTVGNTLRVGFVRRVFPDCRFVHLVRDGRDVAASARRMWRSPPELRRLVGKLRGFPWRAIPTYGLSYAQSYLARYSSTEDRVQRWGPVFPELDDVARTRELIVTCGVQWERCVRATMEALGQVEPADRIEVRYERLIQDPAREVARLFERLGLEVTAPTTRFLTQKLQTSNLGKWKRELSAADATLLQDEIGELLTTLDYPV